MSRMSKGALLIPLIIYPILGFAFNPGGVPTPQATLAQLSLIALLLLPLGIVIFIVSKLTKDKPRFLRNVSYILMLVGISALLYLEFYGFSLLSVS